MERFFIRLAYNGYGYHGWQVQKNALSVQQAITEAIEMVWRVKVNLVGCGRTDTGVHAKEFYAHFELELKKSPDELADLRFRLNRMLDENIVILEIYPVVKSLHARFSAVSRTYQYLIHTRKDPFLVEYSWFVHQQLDIQVMNEGARILIGTHDFTSFSKLHTSAKTNICNVMNAVWEITGHQLVFTITADRFLRNMVRAIVGTLTDLGQGKISLQDLERIVAGKDRSLAGESVPAKGLSLVRVEYPETD